MGFSTLGAEAGGDFADSDASGGADMALLGLRVDGDAFAEAFDPFDGCMAVTAFGEPFHLHPSGLGDLEVGEPEVSELLDQLAKIICVPQDLLRLEDVGQRSLISRRKQRATRLKHGVQRWVGG